MLERGVSFNVASLSGDEVPLALPLIQATWSDVNLASWRTFAASFDDEAASAGSGMLALRDAGGVICGVIAYRIDRDLRIGRILAVHLFTAADLANSSRLERALLDAADARAVELGCAGIQIRLLGQPGLASRLSALGLSFETDLILRKLVHREARN